MASTQEVEAAVTTALKKHLPEALAVRRAHAENDKLGVDFWLECIGGRFIAWHIKARTKDYSAGGFPVFKGMTVPVGTIIGNGVARLPDGKVIELDATDPKTGKLLPPWEIDWSRQSVPPARQVQIKWGKIVECTLLPSVLLLSLFVIVPIVLQEQRSGRSAQVYYRSTSSTFPISVRREVPDLLGRPCRTTGLRVHCSTS